MNIAGLLRKRREVRIRLFFIAVVSLALSTGAYFLWFPNGLYGVRPDLSTYSRYPQLVSGERITVVAPHLDDETLGLGGLIAQARRLNLSVSVVFMTNGDDNPIGTNLQFRTGYPTPDQLIATGVTRQQEALEALAALGVAQEEVIFLGLPDRGIDDLYSSHYTTERFTSPGTLKDHSPYKRTYIPDLPYTGEATRAALLQALTQTQPTVVFTTTPQDKHTDHAATGRFVADILSSVPSHPSLYYFLIHYGRYPNPKGVDMSQPLLPPASLAGQDWQVVSLRPSDVQSKEQAVERYSSQLRIPQLGKLMRALVRSNELVLPGP